MLNKQKGATLLQFLVVLLWLAAIYGYIANIVKIVAHVSDPQVTMLMILRCVGIFAAPLGAIIGFV